MEIKSLSLYSPFALALIFIVKLITLKFLISLYGISNSSDIFVIVGLIQLLAIFQFGKFAKAKTAFLLDEITKKELQLIFSMFSILILIIFISSFVAYSYFIKSEIHILYAFLYGFFLVTSSFYLLKSESLGRNLFGYLTILFLNLTLLFSVLIGAIQPYIPIITLLGINLFMISKLIEIKKIDISISSKIKGGNFFKIESISILLGSTELFILSFISSPQEILIYYFLTRIIYSPILFYGNISRFLWSKGLNYIGNKSLSNPIYDNFFHSSVVLFALFLCYLFIDELIYFLNPELFFDNLLLLYLIFSYSLIQLINRFYKNKYLGEALHEKQGNFFFIAGSVYLILLIFFLFNFPSIEVFLVLKNIYYLSLLTYNVFFKFIWKAE